MGPYDGCPGHLVEALSRAATETETIWRTARPNNDFATILPHLTEMLGVVREAAAAKSAALDLPLYEALLDLYEPGAKTDQIDVLFDDYAAFLPGFLERVLARQAERPVRRAPRGPLPVSREVSLCRRVWEAVG
ncbi:MAG: hypothetical protein VW835_20325, partial [Rickettsiales bacterium]